MSYAEQQICSSWSHSYDEFYVVLRNNSHDLSQIWQSSGLCTTHKSEICVLNVAVIMHSSLVTDTCNLVPRFWVHIWSLTNNMLINLLQIDLTAVWYPYFNKRYIIKLHVYVWSCVVVFACVFVCFVLSSMCVRAH